MKDSLRNHQVNQPIDENELSLTSLQHIGQRFQTLIQNTPNMIIECDPDGHIILVNQTAEQFLNCSADEILGKKLFDIIPPCPDRCQSFPGTPMASSSDCISYESKLFHKDGRKYWIEFNHKTIRDTDGAIISFLTIGIDKTRYKQAQIDLTESRKWFYDIINFLPDATFVVDIYGKVVIWNRAMEELSGVKAEHMIGKGNYEYSLPFYGFRRPLLIDLIFKQDQELEKKYTLARWNNNSIIAEASVPGPEGSPMYLWGIAGPLYDESGSIIGAIESLRDMTEQRREEYAIHESEERYRNLVDTMNDGLVVRDKSGAITFINDRLCHIWGRSRDEIINHDMAEFLDEHNRPMFEEQIVKRVKGIYEPYEITWNHKDGRKVTTILAPKAIMDKEGNFAGSFAVVTDITERIMAEKALEKQALELSRSNSELERFAYVASHDLQEPLRKIQAFGERLKSRCAPNLDERGLDYIERMQNASKRMQNLIVDLLNFSRVTTRAQPFTQVNLNNVLKEALTNLGILIEENHGRIETESLPVIEADRTQMLQLFQNLIGNGLKFHRNGISPEIKIRCQVAREYQKLSSGAAFQNEVCRIEVVDNGIGFDQKYADRIFVMFQRLHSRDAFKGTGIGLAICRKIVERHNGTIEVTSSLGKGTTFFIKLPIKQPFANYSY